MILPVRKRVFYDILVILLINVFLSSIVLFLKYKISNAQIPPPYVSCQEVSDDEFHSLRPYQASPCQTKMGATAEYCGNDLTFHDQIKENYPGNGNCTTIGNKITCTYNESVTKPLIIDLSNANLPFMGNTEDVINSQNNSELLNESDKVNQYVSWYLNGVNNRAEYSLPGAEYDCVGESSRKQGVCLKTFAGFCLRPNSVPLLPDIPDPTITADGKTQCGGIKSCCVTISPFAEKVNMTDRDKLINYSGPLNKLLPQEVQQQLRANTVNAAVKSLNGDDIRHNQIVGCTYGFKIPIIGKTVIGIPAPCYESGIASLIPRNIHRLSEWKNHLPPIRSDYKSFLSYNVAYERWRGKSCAVVKVPDWIPVVGGKGIYLCGELVPGGLLHPNFYAALYPQIPLSSTEDLKGSVEIDSISSASIPPQSDVNVSGVTFSNQTPAILFFSHMEENSNLAGSLQDTFVSKDQQANKAGSPTNVSSQTSCNPLEVRSNKGDDLFATQIEGDLHYDAVFTCDFNKEDSHSTPICNNIGGECVGNDWSCNLSYGQLDCGAGYQCGMNCTQPPQSCTKDVYISLSTKSDSPKVNDIWSRLVAGPQSIFKRIFPKTNTEGGLGQIIDMPGSTNITYTGLGISQQNTDLKIPHIGGVSEYFLKGIQTALRPKGFGDPITFGAVSDTNVPSGKCDGTVFKDLNPPGQTSNMGNSYFTSYILPNLTDDLVAVYKEAERQTGVPCEVLAGIHFEEGSNNPNQSLQDGGSLNGKSLLESAIQAGHQLAAIAGGKISSWNDLITAVSYYNGGGNSNCGKNPSYNGPCPPPSGIDDPYATSYIDSSHLSMVLIYCWDYTQCPQPYPAFNRPGVLTVATELYNFK